MHPVGKDVLRAVSESIFRFPGNDAHLQKIGKVAVEGDFAEANDDANAGQSLNLMGEMGRAVANLLRKRFISRRCAADDRGDPGMAELQPIVAGDSSRLAGEA
jgi:hypothetical protein